MSRRIFGFQQKFSGSLRRIVRMSFFEIGQLIFGIQFDISRRYQLLQKFLTVAILLRHFRTLMFPLQAQIHDIAGQRHAKNATGCHEDPNDHKQQVLLEHWRLRDRGANDIQKIVTQFVKTFFKP